MPILYIRVSIECQISIYGYGVLDFNVRTKSRGGIMLNITITDYEQFDFSISDNIPKILKTNTKASVFKQERDEFTPSINILNSSTFLDVREMIEEDKIDNEVAMLENKVRSGEPLTARELALLKKHSPVLYALALEIQLSKQIFEEQLKNCNSKEEVEQLMNRTVLVMTAKIKNSTGDLKQNQITILNVYKKICSEFKKSAEYNQLKEKDDENKHSTII